MRSFTVPFMMMLIMLSVSTNVQAHDPQNYTILLFEDGPTPEGVVPGILVENDSLFVRNHDTRDNVSHRLVVDLDADGVFTGVDDYSTQWLNSSCDLNETGEKIDENCNVVDTPLRELTEKYPDLICTVVGINRDDKIIIPTQKDSLKRNDKIYLVCNSDHISKILSVLGHTEPEAHNIIIAGAGNVGTYLAKALESNVSNTSAV